MEESADEGVNDDAWVPAENLQAKEKECDDLRREVQRLQRELNSAISGDVGAGPSSKSDLDEIAVLKATLEKKERHLKDLNETVEEAAKVFEEQRAEIEDLKNTNRDLENKIVTLDNEKALLAKSNLDGNSNQFAGTLGEEMAQLKSNCGNNVASASSNDALPPDVSFGHQTHPRRLAYAPSNMVIRSQCRRARQANDSINSENNFDDNVGPKIRVNDVSVDVGHLCNSTNTFGQYYRDPTDSFSD